MMQATNETTFYDGADLDRTARAIASDFGKTSHADGVLGTIQFKRWQLLVGSRVLGGQPSTCLAVQVGLLEPGLPEHTVTRYHKL